MDETLSLFTHTLDIDAIHSDHALWLASEGKNGRRAHFRKSDLTGLNLSGYNFSEASLRGIIIRDVSFAGADLRGCDMSETLVENVNLCGALLARATLSRTHFHNVNMEDVVLDDADCVGMVARNVALTGAKMSRVVLRDADLQDVDFSHAILCEASLRGVQCRDSRFDFADLSQADCREAVFDCIGFSHAIVKNAQFRGAKLSAINVHEVDFTSALEITFDIQTQMVLEEKKHLTRERMQLEEMGSRLSIEQKKLNAQEENLFMREQSLEFAVPYLHRVVKIYQKIGVLWLILSAALLVLTYSRLAQIDISKVSIIVAGVGMVLILSFLSLYFAVKTRNILSTLIGKIPK